MTELHLALSTARQGLVSLLSYDLCSQTVIAEHMLAWEPFGVLSENGHADGTLELLVHHVVRLFVKSHLDPASIAQLILARLTLNDEVLVRALTPFVKVDSFDLFKHYATSLGRTTRANGAHFTYFNNV